MIRVARYRSAERSRSGLEPRAHGLRALHGEPGAHLAGVDERVPLTLGEAQRRNGVTFRRHEADHRKAHRLETANLDPCLHSSAAVGRIGALRHDPSSPISQAWAMSCAGSPSIVSLIRCGRRAARRSSFQVRGAELGLKRRIAERDEAGEGRRTFGQRRTLLTQRTQRCARCGVPQMPRFGT